MNHVSIFKLLLITQSVLTVFLGVLTYYSLDALPTELQHYLNQQQATDAMSQWLNSISQTSLIIIGVAFAALLIINLIGLWLLHNWARHLYTGLTIIGFLIYAFSYATPTVTTGLETLSFDLLNIMTGATIAMMYLPPLSQRFKAKI